MISLALKKPNKPTFNVHLRANDDFSNFASSHHMWVALDLQMNSSSVWVQPEPITQKLVDDILSYEKKKVTSTGFFIVAMCFSFKCSTILLMAAYNTESQVHHLYNKIIFSVIRYLKWLVVSRKLQTQHFIILWSWYVKWSNQPAYLHIQQH